MSSDGFLTRWIGKIQAGDAGTAQPLWERYVQRLAEVGRCKLLGARPRLADKENDKRFLQIRSRIEGFRQSLETSGRSIQEFMRRK